jgi:hypothetical protein
VVRASILVHEFMHSRGKFHGSCADGSMKCDPELNGPYGFSLAYFHFLVHGSHQLLDTSKLGAIDSQMCSILKNNIDHVPAGLSAYVASRDCTYGSPVQLLTREGLSN